MKDDLDKILDECIDRLNRGETIDACLNDFPEHRQELRPILQTILNARSAYFFTPSSQVKSFHRQRLNATLVASREKSKKRPTLWQSISGWSKVWVPVTATVVITLAIYFGLRPTMTPPVMVAQSNPEGNFVFLLSDEANDIGDFRELNISVSKVGLCLAGDRGKIIEFEPETQMTDLTQLQGDLTQEIWRGNIPEGQYNKVFLEVSEVSGVLLESGEKAEIKLPSGKLQVSVSFEVESNELVNFIYDLTVVKAGTSGKYILRPQATGSGALFK